MFRRMVAFVSPLLLAAPVFSVALAPQALAVTSQPGASASTTLISQADQDEYTRGFRDGYRKGHDDGEVDGHLECKRKDHPHAQELSPTDYDRGFVDGYPKGYQAGFDRFCRSGK
jgi:hypothetical protein